MQPVVGKPPAPITKKSSNVTTLPGLYKESQEEVRLLRLNLTRETRAIAAYREQIKQLEKENKELRTALLHDEEDPRLMISFLTMELSVRDQKIADLTATIAKNAEEFAVALDDIGKQYETKMRELERLLDERETTVSEQTMELTDLRHFKNSKQRLLEEVEEVKARLQQNRLDHATALEQQERGLRDELQHTVSLYRQRLESLEAQARKVTIERLDEETRQLVRDNRRMGNELAIYYESHTELTRQVEKLKADKAELEERVRTLMRLHSHHLFPRVEDPLRVPTSARSEVGRRSASPVASARGGDAAKRSDRSGRSSARSGGDGSPKHVASPPAAPLLPRIGGEDAPVDTEDAGGDAISDANGVSNENNGLEQGDAAAVSVRVEALPEYARASRHSLKEVDESIGRMLPLLKNARLKAELSAAI